MEVRLVQRVQPDHPEAPREQQGPRAQPESVQPERRAPVSPAQLEPWAQQGQAAQPAQPESVQPELRAQALLERPVPERC